jgi:outer membrane receptor protein involved in Fe transport
MHLMKLFFPLILLSSSLLAQSSGRIEGVVRDRATKEPLLGANVIIVGTTIGTTTDENGKYVLGGLDPGTYSLRFQLVGYAGYTVQNLIIAAGKTLTYNVNMEVAAVELREIVVNAQRTQIQAEQTGTIQRVTSEEIMMLPVTQFQEAVRLQAGTTLEGNIRGGKTTEVMYLVDGMPMQDMMSGGMNAELPTSSIAELTIQTGGFEAEYGNALSGVINVVTKSAPTTHQFMLHGAKDDLHGGTANSKSTLLEGSAGGPIIGGSLSYYATLNWRQTGTRWWQDFIKTFPADIEYSLSGFGKLDYIYSPDTRLSAQFLFSDMDTRDYEFSWRFNLAGLPPRERRSYRGALIFTHLFNTTTIFTTRVSHSITDNFIGTGSKNDINSADVYQYDLFLQYIVTGRRNLWSSTSQNVTLIKSDLSTQFEGGHLFKAGGEAYLYSLNADIVKYEPQKSYFGKPLVTVPPLNFSTTYNYRPYSGSVFVQDKFEVKQSGMIINLGGRIDFLDPRASRPAIEFIPVSENEFKSEYKGQVPAKIKLEFSPRFGISMPYSESGSIFLNYGHYVQFPLFDYLYSGLDVVAQQRGVSAVVGNPDLKPERTKAWEVSIRHAITDEYTATVLYFRKETENQVDSKTFIPSDSKAAGDYGFAEFVNNPSAQAEGIEARLKKTGGEFVNGEISYTFMLAQGLSENATQGLNLAQYGITPYTSLFYLSWDQRHTIKISASMSLPYDVEVQAFYNFNTAKPFTYFPSRDGFTPQDTLLLFVPNNRRMENYSAMDLKVSRTFSFDETMRAVLYADIRNLFNDKNLKWMDSSGRIGGELGDPNAYYIGFRGTVGVRFEF